MELCHKNHNKAGRKRKSKKAIEKINLLDKMWFGVMDEQAEFENKCC